MSAKNAKSKKVLLGETLAVACAICGRKLFAYYNIGRDKTVINPCEYCIALAKIDGAREVVEKLQDTMLGD